MEKSRKKLYGKILLVFFSVMLVCTAISRAADSMTIPKVTVQQAETGKITYQLKGSGELEIAAKNTYLVPGGFLVESCLENGTKVEPGDVLVQFQLEQLEKRKEELETALEQANLQLEQARLGQEEDAWIPAEEEAQRTLNQAQAEYEQAVTEKQQAKDCYNQALASINPEDETDEQKAAELEELEAALAEADSRLTAASQSLSQAQQALESAKKSDDVTRQNNAKAQKSASYTVEGAQLSVDEAEKNLQEAEDLLAQEGKIAAAEKGIFLNTSVTEGAVTSGSEFISIGTGEMTFTAEVPKEVREKLTEGDRIFIKIPGQEEIETTITQITLGKAKEDSAESTAEDVVIIKAVLPENTEIAAGYASFSITKESEEYRNVLPLTAIHQDSKGYYCLGIRSKDSILGEEVTAERINVQLLEQDDTQAAVEGAIQPDTKVIITSEKNVLAGDRVRIKE